MQKHKSAAAHLQTPTELILNLHSKQIVRGSHVYVKIFSKNIKHTVMCKVLRTVQYI